ncbi:hypothetical protein A2U01_0064515 [Trifolium medium]|uniref:Uncharacterized protein n=1 Tax=Trifolium medium TaxID=97028 RepID=A0A392S352_9FABA|nr:hypothetical protein [Trifolium medium]
MRWYLQNATELNILVCFEVIHPVLMHCEDITQQLGDIQVIHELNNEAPSLLRVAPKNERAP